ncbi:branched-chain amino acid ABC transporter permease/ATP-binding protein [Gordonia sp. CPCC 205515]|uniref:ABC transporter permease subunit n=1 Tax=Gordonia sp. CPCC 205515 TaxID=3140791 RepID=UPI003AF3560B
MVDIVQFAILGLGIGAIYAILSAGMVLIYRGSGTINLAQGHMALLGTYLMYELQTEHKVGAIPALVATILATAVIGALIHLLIMRPLRLASPLSRVIATLAVLTVINEAIRLRYGGGQLSMDSILSTKTVALGSVVIGRQSLYLVAVAVIIVLILTVISARTRLGLAISASAENTRAAAALGWSPDLLAIVTWSVGGALAGLAGALVTSTTNGFFSTGSLSLLIVGTLAAALFAEFRSFTLAAVAGVAIGIAQSLSTRYIDVTGLADAIPFIFIVILLIVRGKGLPVRGTSTDRLPSVGTGRIRPLVVVALTVAAIVLVRFVFDDSAMQAMVVSASIGIVVLSIVVLTGYAGQLSLAQMALAGVGAWAASRLAADHGWPFVPALVIGVLAAGIAGLVFGLPALRTRGINLTVVTFGLGFALFSVLFNNSSFTGGTSGTSIVPQEILGISIEPVLHMNNYATMTVLAFALTSVIVANLRRGATGRRLLTVRSNERAAASLGINVFATKLYAFSLSAAIAGLGGVLLAFSYTTILYPDLFGPFTSIAVLTAAVIGGIGWVCGPIWGTLLVTGGLGVVLVGDLSSGGFEDYVPLVGGLILLVLLIVNQNGIAAAVTGLIPARIRERSSVPGVESAGNKVPVPQQTLQVTGLTQRFGGVTALSEVTLTVEPGKVLGLLGPNGAGKTTLIDAITGYVNPEGTILLGDEDITGWSASRRARAGLGRTFQSLELFDELTVRENLLAACDERSRRSYLIDLIWPRPGSLSPTARAAVDELELGEFLDRRLDELSFGQRRRVAIARTVAMSPSVMLLDEPGAGLDATETEELGHLIRRLADEWGMGVLLIEHDVAMVLRTSDTVHVLDFGRTIFHGDPADVGADDNVRTAYLGNASVEVGESSSPQPKPVAGVNVP